MNNKDYKLEAMKSGIREYIAILQGLCETNIEKNPFNKGYNECFNSLNSLYDSIMGVNNYDQLNNIKNIVIKTEKIIENISIKENNTELTDREKSLITRGYSEEEVKELIYYSDEQINNLSNIILGVITRNCTRVDNPFCIFIGGQPGCGKSTLSMATKINVFTNNNAVEIGLDNYRSFHPNYSKIENIIRNHWKDKVETENDTMGNDIADFTHRFASEMADILCTKLIDNNKKEQYNMIFEWGLRNIEAPLEEMRKLKEKNYQIMVNYIAVHKDISYEACKIRADIMNQQNHIIRRVPKNFHDLCINTLPEACNELYKKGYLEQKLIDSFIITKRDGKVVWNQLDSERPGDIFKKYLEEPSLSKGYENNAIDAVYTYQNEAQGFNLSKI